MKANPTRTRARRRGAAAACVLFAVVSAVFTLAADGAPPSSPAASPNIPAKGRLLVATPKLVDPNFGESVVLLAQHDDGGAIGVIINWPTSVPLGEAIPWARDYENRNDVIRVGGPVQQDLMVLVLRAASPPPESEHLFDDVYFSGSHSTLKFALESRLPENSLRTFVGYAGWGPGQLEAEIARGDWRVLPAHAALVFDAAPETLWHTLIDRVFLPQA